MSRKPKLKVWGITIQDPRHKLATIQGQVRAIVAATSQAEAAKAINVTYGFLRDYGAETGNAHELEVAFAKPGTVFITSLDYTEKGKMYVERGL